MKFENGMRPVHPGEILREGNRGDGSFGGRCRKRFGVPLKRVTMMIEGRQGISADTALRLARYFGTKPGRG